mmetsp:Transcript_2430/g.3623  ORF Transcript_2430/g.3623 Transcript_2430/m.3623 type:complete len:384 (-) Transcript_2430:32-1183(-)|eukprot:CAMPEP_0195519716 /NCGR_PEP_ID=MMETSP0794_2-20130614/15325_1 /TAXON_ID=515487 /ORGANISM="Stephanopyxis turris, Strain CCMP 815" /LENGTH=383 /DNA_ID=CAMNT_0040648919 /DNA_START=102 /DNA_END=1253 /DNA_ORIENTATION=+
MNSNVQKALKGLSFSFRLKTLLDEKNLESRITSVHCYECFQLRTSFFQNDLRCPKHSRSSECDDETTQASSSCSSYSTSFSECSQGENMLRTENKQLKNQLAYVMSIVDKSQLDDNSSTQRSKVEMERLQAENIRLSEENNILKMKLNEKVKEEMAEIDLNGTPDFSNFRVSRISAAVSSSASADSPINIDAQLDVKTEEAVLEVIKKGNIKLIVDAMRTYLGCSRVQKEACRALQTISLKEEGLFSTPANNQDNIRRAGGINVIIDSMKKNADVAEVQLEAFVTLAHLSFGNEQNKNAISENGGIDAIVCGMNKHLDSACILEQGSFALYTLSTKKNRNMPAMRDAKIRSAGGIQVIYNGKARHPTVNSLQRCADAALSRIM